MEYTYISTKDALFVSGDGKCWNISSSESEKREEVLKLIRENAPWSRIKEKLEPRIKEEDNLRKWCNDASVEGSGITFNDSTILIDGVPVYGSLCSQIRLMHSDGLTLDPIVNFVRKMRKNPSYRIREQLWGFIEACQKDGGFTLAEDGDIMAYKVVTSDYKDKHTRTFDNSIGSVVSMPREEVDDNPANTCSAGLHFCAYSYVNSFSNGSDDRIVLVKVNPADVVSIPTDYDSAKARCCRYQVVDEVKTSLNKPLWKEEKAESRNDSEDESKKLKYEAGDVVQAFINDYIFPDDEFERLTKVVGRIRIVDYNDNDMPYCISFYDGQEIVDEWWISEDSIAELLERQGKGSIDLNVGDTVYVCGVRKAKIAKVDYDKGAIVEICQPDGDLSILYADAFDLQEKDFSSKKENESCLHDYSTSSQLDDLRKRLAELQERIKDAVENGKTEDDDIDSKEYVRNWLETNPRKTIISFLESQFNSIVDSDLRISFLFEIDVKKIMEKIYEWIDDEYDGELSEERIWDKVKTIIQFWSKRS